MKTDEVAVWSSVRGLGGELVPELQLRFSLIALSTTGHFPSSGY